MKKRFLAVLLALSAAALTACFGGEESSASSGSAVTSSSSAQEEASAPGESETAPLTEEEVLAAVPDLMAGSDEIERLFRGVGLSYSQPASTTPDANGDLWAPVTDEPYTCVQDILDMVYTYYTPELFQRLYATGLEGQYARYADLDGQLMIDLNQGGAVNSQWQTQTAQLTSQEGDTYVVEMAYTNYDSTYHAAVTLVNTPEGLRIDNIEYLD